MIALSDALNAAGIALRRIQPGEHRAPCPKCDRGPRDDALGVTIEAESAVWHCFRCDWSGGWRPRDPLPAHIIATARREPPEDQSATLAPRWREFWNACREITPNDPAGRYLAGRCCALPESGVRWHPETWHPQERRRFPAMVALITDVLTAEPISLHFTFLAPDGSGKAAIDRPRLYLAGHSKRGVVRLYPDEDVTMGLTVGEGLENCLTAAREIPPVWSCLDAGNLAAFPVLPGIDALTVLVDNDDAGHRAAAAVRRAWDGREVLLIESQTAGEDINDLVRGAA